jgi:hypothetical protein
MIVIDDVISETYQDYIQKLLLDVPWYLKTTLDENTSTDKRERFTSVPGWANVIFNRDGVVQRELYNALMPLAYIACDKIDFKVEEIYFARSFFQQPYPGIHGISNPHVDINDVNHLVCLYYVMDADGDTVFFDKRNTNLDGNRPSFVDYTITHSVTPKKGRCVLFDGRQYHATTVPQNGPRCVVNFNLGGNVSELFTS